MVLHVYTLEALTRERHTADRRGPAVAGTTPGPAPAGWCSPRPGRRAPAERLGRLAARPGAAAAPGRTGTTLWSIDHKEYPDACRCRLG